MQHFFSLNRLKSLVLFLLMFVVASCSAKRRAALISDSPRKLTVTIGDGVLDEDLARKDLIYEVGGCVSGWVNGKQESSKSIALESKEFKPDVVCSMRIRNFALADDKTFKWANGSEPGILYLSSHVSIQQTTSGELVASAAFQQLYSIVTTDPSYELEAWVEFPFEVDMGAPITASLTCNPRIKANGILESTGKKTGIFRFKEKALASAVEHVCKSLLVSISGEGKFSGQIDGDKGKSFTPVAESLIQLTTTPIELKNDVDTTTGKVVVSTRPAEENCKADEVFDTSRGKCIKKP